MRRYDEDWFRNYRWANYDNVSSYGPKSRRIKPVKKTREELEDDWPDEEREDEPAEME